MFPKPITKYRNQYVPSGTYTPSLESVYLPSSVRDSRKENRSAVWLHLAIILFILGLIGVGTGRASTLNGTDPVSTKLETGWNTSAPVSYSLRQPS